jgi:hypothetical protein
MIGQSGLMGMPPQMLLALYLQAMQQMPLIAKKEEPKIKPKKKKVAKKAQARSAPKPKEPGPPPKPVDKSHPPVPRGESDTLPVASLMPGYSIVSIKPRQKGKIKRHPDRTAADYYKHSSARGIQTEGGSHILTEGGSYIQPG